MLLLKLMNYTNCSVQDCSWFFNESLQEQEDETDLYPFALVVPFTFIYVVIFLVGIIGNVSTCIVIARNKSMQNATNSYLFSLACSDLLLLLSGLPPEMYRIWSPDKYIFGEVFCIMQGFFAETSANATVLTITLFTVERYLAICHPFVAQTMSKLSRAIKSIVGIWIISMALAVPQAIQFGLLVEEKNGEEYTHCTLVKAFTGHAFEISTFVIFVVPMLLITILYVMIGIQLRQTKKITSHRGSANNNSNRGGEFKKDPGQKKVIHMLSK